MKNGSLRFVLVSLEPFKTFSWTPPSAASLIQLSSTNQVHIIDLPSPLISAEKRAEIEKESRWGKRAQSQLAFVSAR